MINYFAIPPICARSLLANRKHAACTVGLTSALPGCSPVRKLKFGQFSHFLFSSCGDCCVHGMDRIDWWEL